MSTLGDELIKEVAALREVNNRFRAENVELKDHNTVLKALLNTKDAKDTAAQLTASVTRYAGIHKKTVEIVVDLKDLVPGRTYMCELIKIDDGVEIVALRATDFSVYEKQQGFKKGVCTCAL